MNPVQSEFETWATRSELGITKNDERYDDIETQMFWQCWKAATASFINLMEGT